MVAQKVKDAKGPFGYNVETGEYTGRIKAAVIDAVKVVRLAMQNVSSIAGAYAYY